MVENLQKELFSKKFSKGTGDNDESEDFHSGDTLGDLPSFGEPRFCNTASKNGELDKKATTWNDYFDFNEYFTIPERQFRFNAYYNLPFDTDNALSIPIFIFHHGAGSSGLTFAPLVKDLTKMLENKCGTLVFDARGHSFTMPLSEDSASITFDLDTFTADFKAIIELFYNQKLKTLVPKQKISVILLGHSLGGSICTSVYSKLSKEIQSAVIGVAMFDIVEEAATKALHKISQFLATTPTVFSSMSEAIEYHITQGLSSLRSSAEVTIPPLFKQEKSGKVFRITNLASFQPFWDTWFNGLSSQFVQLPTSKLLILAGSDNLDRELIIGQMQGKYQLVVFQESGHFIQEDAPTKTAITLIDFWRRNDNKNVVIKTNWTKK
ncbi:phosphoprotein phosphatase methylesterase 1 Ecym_8174 [Eremothecium cymbalariae DBVPG|uniref:Protein phosphatase methylesterase 1 n=1 Tax=Eremothecium cymbalariae (strain CBS 270.75 / DBVPG 7215 / KCTC 17166 / NRRL Y-17582) TaxID=931890 RepID=G8JX86_ERECY|nr:Hypothetical protein Ecym_8174 [Eremothecium cymbalariae DBVPG\